MLEQDYWRYRAEAESNLLALKREATLNFTLSPAYQLKPNLTLDGNQWCALFGDNIQSGVAGFGNTPAKAYLDFDRAWHRPIKETTNE